VPCCHTYRPQPIEHVRKPCYGSHTVTPGGVSKYEHSLQRPKTTKLISDSLRRAIHLDQSVLATTSTLHQHTRQPEPQLKVPHVHPLSRATTQGSHSGPQPIECHVLILILSHNSKICSGPRPMELQQAHHQDILGTL